MVKAGQVANPSYGKYALPDTNPYSPYSANSEGKSKESKRSKDYTDSLIICLHGLPGGEGCYLCDPDHPHRRGDRP
jgi:hypothetical protein